MFTHDRSPRSVSKSGFRVPEKARAYFQDFKPEAKDEAIANSLFLTWNHFTVAGQVWQGR